MYEDKASNPVSAVDANPTLAAQTGKQFAITSVSAGGDQAGTCELKIGTTIVWRGSWGINGKDKDEFGAGIKNGNVKSEGVILEITVGGGSYSGNFGWKYV